MNHHYIYFLILGASLAGPLLLSFDKKVAFYKQWKYLFPAMVLPALFFIVWDVFKTRGGVWSFNDEYIIGSKFFSLPLEEILFFFVVPYCCVFIYACMRAYFPSIAGRNWGKPFLWSLVLLFIITAALNTERSYTFYTSLFNVLFITLVLLLPKWFRGFDASSFLVSYAVTVIPFLIVNGFLTAIPVVLYNDAENLGIRIFSFLPWPMHHIPVEDIFYGMLLVFMNIVLYEKLKHQSPFPV
ncbi:lycopene cyclase domain-containing protein [Lacibacter sp. MH-610]|uniref:lycopene cyclase domain-containing protein n=1 Tax=Lacibacter sp. MH-610 TaxID=3020883 RepID=UPI003891E971